MKYKVTQYHHREAIIKGDLCADTIIESLDIFSSNNDVVLLLKGKAKLNEGKGFTIKLSTAVRGKMPWLTIYTNTMWIHENTGEEEQEYYWFKTEKC